MKDIIVDVSVEENRTANYNPFEEQGLYLIVQIWNDLLSPSPQRYLLNYLAQHYPSSLQDEYFSFLSLRKVELVDVYQAITQALTKNGQHRELQTLVSKFTFTDLIDIENQRINTLQTLPSAYHHPITEDELVEFINNVGIDEYHGPQAIIHFYQLVSQLVNLLNTLVKYAQCVFDDYQELILAIQAQSIERQQMALNNYQQEEVSGNIFEDLVQLQISKNLLIAKICDLDIAIVQLKRHGIPSSYLVQQSNVRLENNTSSTLVKLVDSQQNLTSDDLIYIFSFLTPLELLTIAATNRSFNTLAKTPYLWNRLRTQSANNTLQHYFESSPTTYLRDYASHMLEIADEIFPSMTLRSIDVYKATDEALAGRFNQAISPLYLMKLEKALFSFIKSNQNSSSVPHLTENHSKQDVELFIQWVCFLFLQQRLSKSVNSLFSQAQNQIESTHFLSRMAYFSAMREKGIEAEIKLIEDKLEETKKELAQIEADISKPLSLVKRGLFQENCEPGKHISIEINPTPITTITIFNNPSTSERAMNVTLGLILCVTALLSLIARDFMFTYSLFNKGIHYLNKGLRKAHSMSQFFKSETIKTYEYNSHYSTNIFTQNTCQEVDTNKLQIVCDA